MRPALTLAALLCASSAAAFPALELEVGGGASGRDGVETIAPTFSARLGLDLFDRVVVSLRGLSLSPLNAPTQVWGLLADAHVHTRGRFQVNGGLGVGFAQGTFTAQEGGFDARFNGARPFMLADVGVRLVLGHFFAGLNVGGWPWTPVWMGTLTVGVRFFGDA